jgi:hypothetical protein
VNGIKPLRNFNGKAEINELRLTDALVTQCTVPYQRLLSWKIAGTGTASLSRRDTFLQIVRRVNRRAVIIGDLVPKRPKFNKKLKSGIKVRRGFSIYTTLISQVSAIYLIFYMFRSYDHLQVEIYLLELTLLTTVYMRIIIASHKCFLTNIFTYCSM